MRDEDKRCHNCGNAIEKPFKRCRLGIGHGCWSGRFPKRWIPKPRTLFNRLKDAWEALIK